jgi:hypothetical protein
MEATEKRYLAALKKADKLRDQGLQATQKVNKEMRKDRKSFVFKKANARAAMLLAQSNAEKAKADYLAQIGIEKRAKRSAKKKGKIYHES